jgi:hypothetical protein
MVMEAVAIKYAHEEKKAREEAELEEKKKKFKKDPDFISKFAGK